MWNLGDRNSTSFPQKVHEALRKVPYEEGEPLRYHQKLVNEYMVKSGVRGILAYHSLGSGKSRLAASIAHSIHKQDPKRRILFLATKSLHDNFRADLRKYLEAIGESDEFVNKVHFITLNSSTVISHLQDLSEVEDDVFADGMDVAGNLDNTIVIVDEAHNFFNSIANGAKQSSAIYHMIMAAKDIRILFLTGSPIVNTPFEITLCYNMLAGPITIEPGVRGTLFSEHYDDFRKQFVALSAAGKVEQDDDVPMRVANAAKFANRIVGLTSYFNAINSEIRTRFPRVFETKLVTVRMSDPQYTLYAEARDSEIEETRRAAFRPVSAQPLQKPKGASSTYRIRSRQYSNFGPPSNAYEVVRDERNIAHYQFFLDRLKDDQLSPKGLAIISPKVLALLQRCADHLPKGMLDEFRGPKIGSKEPDASKEKKNATKEPGDEESESNDKSESGNKSESESNDTDKNESESNDKNESKDPDKPGMGPGLVYSQFLDFGVMFIARVLKAAGMMDLTPGSEPGGDGRKGTFCVISGLIKPEERTKLIDAYNMPNNRDASVVSLMLFTATGAEGINTKRTRHVHVLDPFWHDLRIEQIIGRAARMDSHADLPESERNVQPYVYLADYPESVDRAKITEPTTDITLYKRALHDASFINEFRLILQESSFDCPIHSHGKINCRLCNPTDVPLFIPSIHKDLQNPDPCQPMIATKVTARSVIVQDDSGKSVEFMYSTKRLPNGKVEIHIFEFDSALGSYREIGIEHPLYPAIKKKIMEAGL